VGVGAHPAAPQRWATDDWPAIFEKALAANILVLAGPIWDVLLARRSPG
jgi:hypothetical protein